MGFTQRLTNSNSYLCLQLLEKEEAKAIFPEDVLARAKEYLSNIKGGTGAYSESKGALICREHVAKGISERDGYPCDVDNLWLTDGASASVNYIMRILIRNQSDAVLVPIPQYPLYSATLSLYGTYIYVQSCIAYKR